MKKGLTNVRFRDILLIENRRFVAKVRLSLKTGGGMASAPSPPKGGSMFSKVVILGRLGADPEARYTPGGDYVSNFNVATSTYVSKSSRSTCPEGWAETDSGFQLTTWWRVTAWRRLGETCNEFLSKGSLVYIEGEVTGAKENGTQTPRIWIPNDGEPRASYEITANVVKFLDRGSSSSEELPL